MIKSWLVVKIHIRNSLRYKIQNTRKTSAMTRAGTVGQRSVLSLPYFSSSGTGLLVKTEWNDRDLNTCRLLSLHFKQNTRKTRIASQSAGVYYRQMS